MRDKEYFWYLLSNISKVLRLSNKDLHYLEQKLKSENLSADHLLEMPQYLSKLLSEIIKKDKFEKIDFSILEQLDKHEFLNEFEKLKSDGVTIIGFDDERYPKSVLQKMGNEAMILYCKGYLELLNRESVAIVGSRDVNESEIEITKKIAKILVENGFNIVSGYAKGVDTSAHLGALAAGGTTTMVLSFGINHLHIRKELKNLNLEKNALFVSQFLPDVGFSGKNAMIRNRLVCAMSKALIVIKSGPERDKSGKMSGTFNAAKYALNLKKKIPVIVLSPKMLKSAPEGNKKLIDLGAIEIDNEIDIVKHIKKEKGQYSQESLFNQR